MEVAGASQDLIDSSIMAATEVYWALSGRRYGLCDTLVRPHRRYDCYGSSWPHNMAGCFSCHDGYRRSCTEVDIPGPIGLITQVKIDGVVFGPGNYVALDRTRLVRIDGECWPSSQRLDLADTEVGTWAVAYTIGAEVPELGRRAVAELATELVKSCMGATCQLPARVTSLTRQGVSMALIDPQEFLSEGRTGMYLGDLFIKTHNPAGLQEASRVYSPDLHRPRTPTA